MEDRITIIHGLNGIGKTNLLRLIDGFFNFKYSELRSIPFDEFKIFFDNEQCLTILIQQIPEIATTTAQLQNKLNQLDNQRKLLINVGLLKKEDYSNFQVPDHIDESS
ncbi:MAG: hypothetical protein AB4058_21230 [Microcystaceae cyanobacterium]